MLSCGANGDARSFLAAARREDPQSLGQFCKPPRRIVLKDHDCCKIPIALRIR